MTRHAWRFGPFAAIAVAMAGPVAEQHLSEIVIPGLAIDSEFTDVRRALLAAFPRVVEVFAVRMPEALLIAYTGEEEIDAWCETLSRAVAVRRRALLGADQPSRARTKAPSKKARPRAVAAWQGP
jgi:hypothetical protein